MRIFLGLISIVLGFHTTLGQAPANDLFAKSLVLSGWNASTNGNNLNATIEPGEPTGTEARRLEKSLWYSWKAPTYGNVRIHVDSALDHQVSIYEGAQVSSLVEITSGGIDTGNLSVTNDQQLAIAIQTVSLNGVAGRAGGFRIQIEFQPTIEPSTNDTFANAIAITSFPFHFNGDLRGATREAGEPSSPDGNDGTNTQWWKFAPTQEGVLTVSCPAPWSSRLAIYEGTNLTSLTWLQTTEQNPANVHTLPGHVYYVQLTTWISGGGPDLFTLSAWFSPKGANDAFTDATQMEAQNQVVRAWILSPTIELGEPLDSGSVTGTLWWSWAAPADGRCVITPLFVDTSPPTGGAKFKVYSGPTLDHLTPVPGTKQHQDAPFIFSAKGGMIYHIQVWARGNNVEEPTGFDLNLFPFGLATNDNFANAANPIEGPKSNVGATRELGEPLHRETGTNKSIWWKWIGAANRTRAGVLLGQGTITNVVLGVYQGASVDTLTLVAKGTNRVNFDTWATETYHIAAETPEMVNGDIEIRLLSGLPTTTTHEISGNLIKNPSFEDLGNPFAEWTGSVGGVIWETAPDGRNYCIPGQVEQNLATVSGEPYRLRFVYSNVQGFETELGVHLNGTLLGRIEIPAEMQGWSGAEFEFIAPASVTRLEFRAGQYGVGLDQVSVVRLSQPPLIITQPKSLTTFAGSTVMFHAGLAGAEPIVRKWFFNGQVIPGRTNATLILTNVTAGDAGEYYFTASNPHGATESARVTLAVENATSPQLVLQPQSEKVVAGQYFVLQTAAVGTPPLRYEWFRNGDLIENAADSALTFSAFGTNDVGVYTVKVSNAAESVISLPATLTVAEAAEGGGVILFANQYSRGFSSLSAPVFDVDGLTRLSGSNFVAQLYAGPAPDSMRAVGEPSLFLSGFSHGFWSQASVVLPNVAPDRDVYVQARVWDGTAGASYEAARALGGKFGRSTVLHLLAGYPTLPPLPDGAVMEGLGSFQLQSGLPGFVTGTLSLLSADGSGTMEWQLNGAAGFRYLVERQTDGSSWLPFQTLTNQSGTATFSDARKPEATVQLYRARMLD